jgi:hypothetical protein
MLTNKDQEVHVKKKKEKESKPRAVGRTIAG